MKTKHTPGPWKAVSAHDVVPLRRQTRNWRMDIFGADGQRVARTNAGTLQDADNARLIAAAPDLYEFVKSYADQECWQSPGEYPEAGESGHAPCPACQAMALIAKVDGR